MVFRKYVISAQISSGLNRADTHLPFPSVISDNLWLIGSDKTLNPSKYYIVIPASVWKWPVILAIKQARAAAVS